MTTPGAEPVVPLDRRAQAIMDTLVVVRGLSYVDAIREAERLAAPYLAVAERLRAELAEPKR